jgi:hypothetical protein
MAVVFRQLHLTSSRFIMGDDQRKMIEVRLFIIRDGSSGNPSASGILRAQFASGSHDGTSRNGHREGTISPVSGFDLVLRSA